MKLSGLAGLYGRFIGLSHAWLALDAISCWLVPSEFMDVNYGLAIKWYLLNRVTLLHIHRFDPIVCFRNTAPPADHSVIFTFGGTLAAPLPTASATPLSVFSFPASAFVCSYSCL